MFTRTLGWLKDHSSKGPAMGDMKIFRIKVEQLLTNTNKNR